MKKPILASQLKRLMKERGVSARALAKATGIPTSSLNNLLAGRLTAKAEYMMALCEYFSMSWEQLVFGVDTKALSIESYPGTLVFDGVYRIRLERIAEKK